LASGSKPGDQVPGVGYEIFKVRAKNSDASRGKSGSYRLIYHAKSESEVILVTVYSKTEQADIAPEEIRQIILDLKAPPDEASPPNAAPEQQDSGPPQQDKETP
jgi:hypothetical protein